MGGVGELHAWPGGGSYAPTIHVVRLFEGRPGARGPPDVVQGSHKAAHGF